MKTARCPQALSQEVERKLEKRFSVLADYGFPLDEKDIRMAVKRYLDAVGVQVKRFKDNLPGKRWLVKFKQRHRLVTRIATNIKRKRAELSDEVIIDYIKHLEKEVNGVPPANIWNYDETCVQDNPGAKKVIIKRGVKYPERVQNHSKIGFSVMFCGNAEGETMPPYTVYKATGMYNQWRTGGPKGSRYNSSPSGWFDEIRFEDWFFSLALPRLRKQPGAKVLLGDNLSSHISDAVINACAANNIRFVCLPPNSTHVTQPLDVAFFSPLKRKWREVLSGWKATDEGRKFPTLPKWKFPVLLKELVGVMNNENLKVGFETCGIVPVSAAPLLRKLPQRPIPDDSGDILDQTLLDSLEAMRGSSSGGPSRTRRTRVNVVPGKSVVAQGLSDDSDEEDEESDENETSESEDEEGDVGEEDDKENDAMCDPLPADEPISLHSKNGIRPAAVKDLKIGDFVVVRFEGKVFLASTDSRNKEGTVTVKFLKNIGGEACAKKFVYPVQDDLSVLYDEELIGIVERCYPDRRGSTWTVFTELPFSSL